MRKNNFEFLILNFELNAWHAKDEGRGTKKEGEVKMGRWEVERMTDARRGPDNERTMEDG